MSAPGAGTAALAQWSAFELGRSLVCIGWNRWEPLHWVSRGSWDALETVSLFRLVEGGGRP